MPIDNDYYNRIAGTGWDESQPLSMLLTGLNPGRFGYFRDVLSRQLQIDPRGTTALDIGCGGGILAEEFARLGCRVTGIDPSAPTLKTARAHARQSGLGIEYRVGVGEHLPVGDAGFDIVYCCDVLETALHPCKTTLLTCLGRGTIWGCSSAKSANTSSVK